MNNEKQPEIRDPLEFLSLRLREILRRLAKADRRDDLQELAWLIEGYAKGRLRDTGDETATPRVPLDRLPDVVLVENVRVRQVPARAAEIDAPQPSGGSGA